ncbi:MAG: ABC transporter ATP-binding protein [Rhodospirillales bacterium]|nr:ABC transporter ATP-binding protein [Rhodospirillales bacterium]MDH3912133.1 ABC transporter ATP-binding protein [Rhodospirillales bacterium]MDH3966642.1 ABC transporter ATP-binding protein [Rhodospirillales bacterium]
MISVQNLVFDYPGLRALHGVTFEVGEGSITALVGPNGAGKTTLLRCIASLETPVAGRISVDGVDVQDAPRQCHRRMGYLSDFFGLYNELTVEQCLRHRAAAQDVPPGERAERVSKAAERTGLGGRLGQKAGELSRGLRQRLAIAQSILHEPRVVLLDEPASGLDPEARAELSRLFLGLRAEGMTLVVSSHILAELEDYSTHMMILREGRLIEHRRIDGAEGAGRRVSVVVRLAEPSDRLPALVEALPDCEVISADESAAKVMMPAPALERHRALKRLVDEGLAVAAFEEVRPDLQEAYLAHLREEPQS